MPEEEKKECRNCRHAFPTLLGWIFCRNPIRMKKYDELYSAVKIPEGGFPQSLNHSCHLWEKVLDKYHIELIVDDHMPTSPIDFAERIKLCLELAGYTVEIGGWY